MMNLPAKLLLVLLYLSFLPIRYARALLGRDRLNLRRPRNAASYWVVRTGDPDMQSYFSEMSVAEGGKLHIQGGDLRSDRGAARWLMPVLRLIARLCAPPRE